MTAQKTVFFVGLMLVCLTIPFNAGANDCMTSTCHTDFKKLKQLHFPAEDNCHRCHEVKGDPALHRFSLVNQIDVCFQCHDENRKGKHVHEAISSSQCNSCHNSHGGNYNAYLKTGRIDTLCFECHGSESFSKKNLHDPLRTGDCTSCHRPHASDYASLLISKKEELCIQCHKDKDFSKPKENMYVHSIVQEGCAECHSPHSSEYPNLLAAAPGSLCGKCHEDLAEKAKTVKFKHATLAEDKKCMNCHEPHASAVKNNLKKGQPGLCYDCHNKSVTGSGARIFNIYRIMKDNPLKHKPLEQGNCSACHDPHGSDFFKLLSAAYPTRFYAEFTVDIYQFCFQCHDPSLAEAETARKETNFRDGTKNLHFLHVHRKKGRTCRVCHEVHAGKLQKMIREDTPFGKWNLPIGFKKTPTGGSCSPGCHVPFTYDREKQ